MMTNNGFHVGKIQLLAVFGLAQVFAVAGLEGTEVGEAARVLQMDSSPDVIIYVSDLPDSAFSEFGVLNDSTSPGGRMAGIPNSGDELDPPPENDPHMLFKARVRGGVPYRCWIHMKVGAPKGISKANVLWVQFSNAVDSAGKPVFAPGSNSYLTALGPVRPGWSWVGCQDERSSAPYVYFQSGGEITVRVQAGMEGVGFDQLLLSSATYLNNPPSEAIIKK